MPRDYKAQLFCSTSSDIRNEIYERFSARRAKGVKIDPSLCFYNPYEVYTALTSNERIIKWLEFISNHYIPPKTKVLLIYPCSAEKPFHESRSYKSLFRTLSKLGEKRKEIHLVTISEPFGLVPEEFYNKKLAWHDWGSSWYDCPGLFEWWCKKYRQPYSKEYLEKCVQILASYIAKFLERAKFMERYSKIIGFVRTYSSRLNLKADHTHRRMLELANEISRVEIDLLPPKEIIAEIVSKRGKVAWDLYGVSHPIAQDYLFNYLRRLLDEN